MSHGADSAWQRCRADDSASAIRLRHWREAVADWNPKFPELDALSIRLKQPCVRFERRRSHAPNSVSRPRSKRTERRRANQIENESGSVAMPASTERKVLHVHRESDAHFPARRLHVRSITLVGNRPSCPMGLRQSPSVPPRTCRTTEDPLASRPSEPAYRPAGSSKIRQILTTIGYAGTSVATETCGQVKGAKFRNTVCEY